MNRFSKKILAVQISSAVLCGSWGFSVNAQNRATLEEVIVTAQKEDQALTDVGAAISVIGGTELSFRNLANAQDIAMTVPNVSYGEVNGASQITIRGIGLNVESGFAEPAVAVHIDGVYMGRANAATLGLSDLASVEVLRGPQGTLYGRNATGGVVNFITKKPTKDFEAGLTGGFGSYGSVEGSGYISGSLAPKLKGRFSASVKDDDGYLKNKFTGKDQGGKKLNSYKGDLSWDIVDSLSADLSYMKVSQDSDSPYSERLTPSAFTPAGALFDPKPRSYYQNITPKSELDLELASLTLALETDSVTVRSITGYTHFDHKDNEEGDFTSLDILRANRKEKSETFSQEFNLSGRIGETFDWVTGLFLFKERSYAFVDVTTGSDIFLIGLPPVTPVGTSISRNVLKEEVSALGVFGDGTYHITDDLRLKAGFRYSQEEKKARQTVGAPVGGCNDLASTRNWYDFAPKAGVEWNVLQDVLAYATFQKGFKSGGFNQSGCNTFEPEHVTSYEVGVKGKLLDDRVYFSTSFFHYDYTDLQTLRIIGGLFAKVDNAGQSTINGIEIESKFLLSENLAADVNISWLDATYDEFLINPDPTFDPPGTPVQDFGGNTLNRSPKYSAYAGLAYTIPIGGGILDKVRLRAEYAWSDAIYFRPNNIKSEQQDSYGVVNLYAALISPNEKYQLKAFVKNATDEDYLVSNQSLFESNIGQYAAPRTWGIEASVKWE